MAKRPALMFYPADWRGSSNLRRCSPAARGVWMDVLCLLHDSDPEYGVLRWPLADIAQAVGADMKHVRELVQKGVLKGGECGADAFTFTPRHAGQDGATVTLVIAETGPCWYSSRMVRDEYIRTRRGGATRFESSDPPPKAGPEVEPKPPIGGGLGDGPSVAVAFALSNKHSDAVASGASTPTDPIFGKGLAFLISKGVAEQRARSFLGKLRKDIGDVEVSRLLSQAEKQDITGPVAWLEAAAKSHRHSKVADDFRGVRYQGTPAEQQPEWARGAG